MVDVEETVGQIVYKPGGPAIYAQEKANKRMEARAKYNGEEDNLACARFPHLKECNIDGESAQAI